MKLRIDDLSFQPIGRQDVPALTRVMTAAFDDDSQKHLGLERGGPPGYDDGEFFNKWLFAYQESIGYKILSNGQIIGGILVWIFPHGNNQVGTIFVDPTYQDRGVGSRTWQFIQERYPQTKSWKLETPVWATKNHHFYQEKCGFEKVGQDSDMLIYLRKS